MVNLSKLQQLGETDGIAKHSRGVRLSCGKGIKRSPKTLAKYRCVGGGPPFVKFGATDVRYDEPDLDKWVIAQLSGPFGSTSEIAA